MSQGGVVVVGGGIMGCGIAAVFLRAHWRIQLVARNPDNWSAIRAQVIRFAGQAEGAPGDEYLQCLSSVSDVEWDGIEMVIETITENLDIKRQLFRELDSLVPSSVPVATNTSGFRVTDIAESCVTRQRMAHAHFFMPAHVVPLVELAKADFTSDDTINKMHQVFAGVALVPVRINRDIPGLLANRMQHALMREAFSMVQQGLASPDDIDAAVRFGFGFRYLAAGPILQKEFSGLDTQFASASAIYPSLSNDTEPAAVLREKVEAGHLGLKSGQGFRAWPDDVAAAEKERYERVLADAVQLLMRDD